MDKISNQIYWLSWDGKRKGQYTVRGIVGHEDGYLKGKIFLKERKKPLEEEHVITEVDGFSQFNLHEGRRYFSSKLQRDIFEKRVQPYL